MTINISIYTNTTNKLQNKLHNSKIIARAMRAIFPKYRAHLKHLKH